MSEPERWIVVIGWERFQHYQGGPRADRPPWIKTYVALLHDDAYLRLTLHQRGVLHGLWLEYATARRQLPDSTATISRRLGERVTRATLDALNHAGFITFSASKPLAARYQDASPERERDREQAHTSKTDAQAALQLDHEKAFELTRIIGELHGVNGSTWSTLEPLAARVPLSVLADLRTRSTGKGPGWVIRALQDEIRTA